MKIAVTGAFSYSGKYITRRLLAHNEQVITLTNHPNRPDPFDGRVKAYPLNFDEENILVDTLSGVDVLVNTTARGGKHKSTYQRGGKGWCETNYSHQYYKSVRGIAPPIFLGKGGQRKSSDRIGHELRHPAPHGFVRQGGYPHK